MPSRYQLIVGALAVALVGGCMGPKNLGKVKDSTAEARFEFELLEHAALVREDTSPDPQGRFAFRRGNSRLLVVSRVTSVADPQTSGQRTDRVVERLWITIPEGAPLNATIKLQGLEEQFLVGYDRDDGHGFFIRPNRTIGTVTMLERDEEKAVVKLDVKVAPIRMDVWNIRDTVTAAVTESGQRATKASDVPRYRLDALPEPLFYDKQLEPGGSAVDPTAMQLQDRDSLEVEAAGSKLGAEEVHQPSRRIVGKWFGTTPEHADGLYYELHFQFNEDGTFVHSTGRRGEGVAPGMKYGRYRRHNDQVIMDVAKFVFRRENVNHLPPDGMVMRLRIGWDGDQLLLSGDLKHPVSDESKFGTDLAIRLSAQEFPDLRKFRPQANLQKGYDPIPEPQWQEIIDMKRPASRR